MKIDARWAWVLVAGWILYGCDPSASAGAKGPVGPAELDGQECAACGMIVREQPSPRGQLVHRDGTRSWFCSIADMLTYLEAPSPHGPAVEVFVEAMPPEADDPTHRHTEERPWIPAKDATFVRGFERERIMGEPYLTYRTRADAERVAGQLQARATGWEALRDSHPADTESAGIR